MESIFEAIPTISYEGPDSDNPLAFRHYEADKVVLGKTMADHLRWSVCYWHTFCGPGDDMFGSGAYQRPWFETADPMEGARMKCAAAFEFFEKIGTPFFCFHDVDVAPEGASFTESAANLKAMLEVVESEMARTGVKLLWGTANLFSHPRYAAGAATNPNPEVFAYAAAQVATMLEATHALGGANYVLWGGREGYDTLLNTDLKREADQLGRFLSMVVEHKHAIGFEGTLLIEPKPHEPTKHQYDHDAAAVHAFLQKFDLQDEFKLNIEGNHATLSGNSFQHEVAYAAANGILGSIDINRGDPQNGWDTDEFPNSTEETSLVFYEILKAGGLGSGGFNFDAKLRRQSVDPEDLFHAHIGGLDVLARSLECAARLLEEEALQPHVDHRYRGWETSLGKDILDGGATLGKLRDSVTREGFDPQPESGRQEMLENIVNRYR